VETGTFNLYDYHGSQIKNITIIKHAYQMRRSRVHRILVWKFLVMKRWTQYGKLAPQLHARIFYILMFLKVNTGYLHVHLQSMVNLHLLRGMLGTYFHMSSPLNQYNRFSHWKSRALKHLQNLSQSVFICFWWSSNSYSLLQELIQSDEWDRNMNIRALKQVC
jgi:hypothetical protein